MRSSDLRRMVGSLACVIVLLMTARTASAQSQGRFAPPHADAGVDTDGDGTFNVLEVDVHVVATVAGTFVLAATLYDGTNTTLIDMTFQFLMLSGSTTIPVNFTGSTIRVSGIDGPYQVNLELYNDVFALVDFNVHTTWAYQHTQFDAPGATFAPPHADAGEDRDAPPDGRYNTLRVDVRVNVTEPGTYGVYGNLWDVPPTTFIGSDARSVDLTPGIRTVPLFFGGLSVWAAAVDGPYVVDLLLEGVSGMGMPTILDTGNHTTGPYLASDFQGSNATVQGTVVEAQFGLPVANLPVSAYNVRDSVYLYLETDFLGGYGFDLYAGDWIFTYDEMTWQAELRSVVVSGATTVPTVRLSPMAPASAEVWCEFPTWDEERTRMEGVLETDNATFRLTTEWQYGDRDGVLTMDEFNRSTGLGGGAPPPPGDSATLFDVDGIPYGFVPGSLSVGFGNVAGPVTAPAPPHVYENLSFAAAIPLARSHGIDLNVSYDLFATYVFYVVPPPLYALASFTSAPSVSIWDMGGGVIAVDPGLPPGPGVASAWIQLVVNATDTTPPAILSARAVPDPAELGQPTTVEANVSDANGVDSVRVAVRDPSGAPVGNYTMAHGAGDAYAFPITPAALGTYGFTVTAYDTVGNPAVASGTFLVRDTVAPTADAGPDQAVPRGTLVAFDGSGSADADRVANYTWTFEDAGARTLYGPAPTYRFDRTGTFAVTLTARDPSGNAATDEVRVTVTPTTGALRGTVRDEGGSAVEGASVRLLSGTTVIANATTNATGGYVLPEVAPGTYTVRAEKAGFEPATDSVTVSAGGTATRDLTLTRVAEAPPSWVVPAAIAGVLLAVAAIAGAAYALRRRRRREDAGREGKGEKKPEGGESG